jgi:uncharacterized membrane protein YfcA
MFGSKKKKQKPEKVSYEELGRMLESIYESGYIDHKRTYKMSFLKGVMSGFGGVIGATLVVALLAWVLSLLHYVPFVNDVTDNVKNTVENRQAQ